MDGIKKINRASTKLRSKYTEKIEELTQEMAKDFIALFPKYGVTLYQRIENGYTSSPEYCMLLRSWLNMIEGNFGFSMTIAIEKEFCKNGPKQLKKRILKN
ncbi:MAG: hypothetical protein PHE59_04055 [Patescibacteria group bacterium]|nr:hypothetical protein [Patescibacteria group bacterium]MDD5164683.1 hypothetical protein [Patescibacteria group bacterium]MDD5534995.1 hypothetical protein [Patescibacteria group bacterium]